MKKTNKNLMKKFGLTALSLATVFSTALAVNPLTAAGDFRGQLQTVDAVEVKGNVVNVTYNNGAVTGKITFLENGIFRYNVDPKGEFSEYATPNSASHTATIQAQADDSDKYSHPDAAVNETESAFEISTNGTTIILDKATAKMTVKNAAGKTVMSESAALAINSTTVQSLNTNADEYFFGGGTQNGRFTHKGKVINIKNESGWTDGKVASPNPFYWSTEGYGVLRNTFKQGTYDFGSTSDNVLTTHSDSEFDAYYFVSNDDNVADMADTLLNEYFEVTGNPMLLPEYAFYLAHLNCYNRDAWQEDPNGKWTLEDGKKYTELSDSQGGYHVPEGAYAETLNNEGPSVDAEQFKGVVNEDTYKFSARAVVDGHVANDMPLGWFLPNDGYGCGYGQNGYYSKRDKGEDTTRMYEVVDANVENLRKFTEYAEAYGVRSGLWTQAALTPETSEKDSRYQGFQTLRDFDKEVNVAGVSALKTDVAWVGSGYSMALNSVKDGYNILASSGKRPTIVSLDGWAGYQRYASIWTGDQTGGQWEYIRFHIPTYIGQSLAGNPNIGSDVDGIFGGSNLITTRDLQFKTFTQTMLDMDGWGSIAKKPYIANDPYKSINRMYLKLKAQLMPYIYTYAHEAVDGLPMIRAMFLEEANKYTYGTATQYQYMFGDNFLVAPVYQDTNADEMGNDVRNNIYLPGTADTWIDYFTGKQYSGGQVVNNFDAPIWKLPLFVKNGAIIPMYENHNNPMEITDTNTMGLDKTRRIVEFYPHGETSFDLVEDDGISLDLAKDGTRDYGGKVITHITSKVEGDKATLTIDPSKGSYEGYEANRHTTFVVNVSQEPTALTAKNGNEALALTKVDSYEAFEAAAANNEAVWFYDETPNLNKYAADDEAFKDTEITTTPKIYVSFAKTNVDDNAQTLVVNGFANKGDLMQNQENKTLAVPANVHAVKEKITPTEITLAWDEVKGATGYQVEVDGMVQSVISTNGFVQGELAYESTHNYRVRATSPDGYSKWSNLVKVTTDKDPYRNVIPSMSVSSSDVASGYKNTVLVDRDFNGYWFTDWTNNAVNNRDKVIEIDLKQVYKMDKVELYPALPGYLKNQPGVVTIYGSDDKVNYDLIVDHYDVGERDDSVKVIPLNGAKFRYMRIVVSEPAGTYVALSEIMPYKVDGTGVVVTDKSALQIAVDLAATITNDELENVLPAVVTEFKTALTDAQKVLANKNATQRTVDAAFDRLANAMHMLSFFKGDKEALINFVEKVRGLDGVKYIEDTWVLFAEALNNAEAIVADENAMQDEINEAYDTLVRTFLDLRLKPNKDALKDLLGKAKALNEAALAPAIEAAQAVYDNPNASQREVDAAFATLNSAVSKFAPVAQVPAPTKPGDIPSKGNAIKTGDNTNIVGMTSLLGLSVAAYLITKKRKEND